jgi:hypothetical protein
MPFFHCRLWMSLLTCIKPQHIHINRDINCPSTVYNKRKTLQSQHIHVNRDINCPSTVYNKRKALQPQHIHVNRVIHSLH